MIRFRAAAPAAPIRIAFFPPIRSESGPLTMTDSAYVQNPAVAIVPNCAFERWKMVHHRLTGDVQVVATHVEGRVGEPEREPVHEAARAVGAAVAQRVRHWRVPYLDVEGCIRAHSRAKTSSRAGPSFCGSSVFSGSLSNTANGTSKSRIRIRPLFPPPESRSQSLRPVVELHLLVGERVEEDGIGLAGSKRRRFFRTDSS